MDEHDPPLPRQIPAGEGVLLRCWVDDDVEPLSLAIAQSIEHLRPWMEWVAQEPLEPARRARMIADWEARRLQGGDAVYGIHHNGAIAGGCGLHRRLGSGGLEIGYWLHPAFLGRGIATRAAAALTTAAFATAQVSFVEIHHDQANRHSGAIPRRLGFVLTEEVADEPEAPAESGIECRWRMERDHWRPDEAVRP